MAPERCESTQHHDNLSLREGPGSKNCTGTDNETAANSEKAKMQKHKWQTKVSHLPMVSIVVVTVDRMKNWKQVREDVQRTKLP